MYHVTKIMVGIVLACIYVLWRDTIIIQTILWASLGYMAADAFDAAWERISRVYISRL